VCVTRLESKRVRVTRGHPVSLCGGEILTEVVVGQEECHNCEAVCAEHNALISEGFGTMLFLWGNVLFSLLKEDLKLLILINVYFAIIRVLNQL